MHSSKGQATLQKAADQEEGDKSVRALLQTYETKRPVALLIDDRYALFPYDLTSKPDCTYVVLGFYHIAHAWGECLIRSPASSPTENCGSGAPTSGQQHWLRNPVQVCLRVVR